jgi:hypothetical protein
MPERESGVFPEQNNGQHQVTQDTAAWHLPYVLDFNWASTRDEFQTMQYQYLANTVFENYSMHLEARRQSSMDRAQFLTCLRLLYTNMSADAEELHTLPGSGPGEDGDNSKPLKQESSWSEGSNQALHHTSEHGVGVKLQQGAEELHTLLGSAPGPDGDNSKPANQQSPSSQGSYQALPDMSEQAVGVKLEKGVEQYVETGTFSMPNAALDPTPHDMHVNLKAGTHASSLRVLVGITGRADEPEQDPTVLSRDDKYREKKEELQRLVSTVLYLTEIYGVAQTRGGAQVSQYRRTLTAQSHTLLVQRLARELQQTEAGFWAWLHHGTTPPAHI